MNKFNRLAAALLLIFVLLFNIASCNIPESPQTPSTPSNPNTDVGGSQTEEKTFYIEGPSDIELAVGESITLNLICKEDIDGEVSWSSSSKCASVEDGTVTARSTGVAIIKAYLGDKITRVIVTVVPKSSSGSGGNGSGSGSNIVIPDDGDPIKSDPYVGVDVDEFYENYTPAISYMDAYYRTKHYLMSGSIEDQDQEPTLAPYQPKVDGKHVKNISYLFSEDGNTYYVVDSRGEIILEIYKGGAYVVLEEVAAYVFAFGEPPANQTSSKDTRPSESSWGEYLRLNNTKFSGSTSKYPYEPALPRITGCGGDLTYFEMDIGTTGTDCDPGYKVREYNNGYSITRGAARLVYSCKDRNNNKIIDLDERYVFYTYNHYNDFQEYLNYYGGWGEMFGNITGGGVLSSKYNYNPTPYVEVEREALYAAAPTVIIYYYVPKNEHVA